MSSDVKYTPVDQSEEPDAESNVQIVSPTASSSSVGDGIGAAGPESRQAVLQASLLTASVILCYFILSISLTFYNRWLYRTFNYPLFVTSYHLFIKLVLATIVRILYRLVTGRSRVLLDWRTCFYKLAPTGLASGIDIGFSNWGLGLVTISLYTMTKSTTIVFILIFALLLKLERKSWSLLVIVVMISAGLFMFTFRSTQFNALGFAFLLFASLSSGVRWTLAQLIMQKSKIGLHNPIDMVFHMQPWMIVSLVPFTVFFDGPKLAEYFAAEDPNASSMIELWIKISVGAFVAFLMELSEFLTLSYTSSLTLSVCGIFKEICQLVLAVEVNHDQLTLVNVAGLLMCVGGIVAHVLHKYSQFRQRPPDEDEPTVVYENRRRTTDNGAAGGNMKQALLDSDDLDFSESDSANGDDSNVIFDVLKRRDLRR